MKFQESKNFEKGKERSPQRLYKISIHNLIYLEKPKLNKKLLNF